MDGKDAIMMVYVGVVANIDESSIRTCALLG